MEIVAGGEGGGEEGRVQLSSGKKGRKFLNNFPFFQKKTLSWLQ